MLLSFLLLLLAQDVAQPGPNTVAVDLPAAIQLAQEGHDAEALAALQKIAAADPNDHLTRLWIANVYARMGHADTAEAIYHSIVLEDPRNVDAWVGLGTVLLRQDRVSQGLDALRRAEELAPQNPNVWAALASAYQLSGDTQQSLTYRQRLATVSPTVVNQMDLESARRDHGHHFESQTFGEDYNGRTPTTRGEDLALNYRVSETFRVIGRGQVQRKFDRNEDRFGGGAEWRWTPWGTLSGQVLINDHNRVLPQRDYMGRVDYGYHRATYTGTLRYFDFFGANTTMFSPAVTVALTPRWTGAVRYAFTTTDTATVNGVESHTFEIRAAHEIKARIWARGGYISGIENFDQFSIDHTGEFRAKTVNGSVQILLPSLTSIVGSYDYQWRKNGVHMGRVYVSLVQAF
jgi:Tfp pilus assembly protein PilF